MSKSNRRKRELQRERASEDNPNPLLYTPASPWTYMTPVLTMPGKP